MKIWLKTDLAWAAGFIDGEGSFCLTKRIKPRLSYDNRISAGQTSVEPLCKLKDMFGGIVKISRLPHKWHRKTMYHWQVCNRMAHKTAVLLLPYLIVKKERAALMICYCENKTLFHPGAGHPLSTAEKKMRNEMIEKMKFFNGKGLANTVPHQFIYKGKPVLPDPGGKKNESKTGFLN